jgi:hypothetical protein
MKENNIKAIDCKDKHLYYIRSTTSDIGVYLASKRAFVTLQKRGGLQGIALEYHKDVGSDVGRVECLEELEKSEKLDWEGLSLSPQEELMRLYLQKAEEKYDVKFRNIFRNCQMLNRLAMEKSDRGITDNIIKGWCRGDKDMFDRVKVKLLKESA